LFARYGVNTFNAIVINYTVCLALGTLIGNPGNWPFSASTIASEWFKFDLLLGFLFIIGFNLTARSIQLAGITLTTMIQRMSLLITVSFTVIVFKERFGPFEFSGLILAIFAIAAITNNNSVISFKHSGTIPLLLLLVMVFSAAIEIILFYVEKSGIVGNEQLAFTTHGFGIAAVLGWLTLIFHLLKGKLNLTRKDVIAGILLGLPNFFSIFLILKMLNQGWKGPILYPMINVTVLLLSTFTAILLFKERLNKMNWLGIILACASILVIAYAHNLSR
jgi:drug/metabolite transporter (DMT)-like permease